MSSDARMLRALLHYLALDQRAGYAAAIEREHMRMRCRLLAQRIIEGWA